jgi:hypothetical protein
VSRKYKQCILQCPISTATLHGASDKYKQTLEFLSMLILILHGRLQLFTSTNSTRYSNAVTHRTHSEPDRPLFSSKSNSVSHAGFTIQEPSNGRQLFRLYRQILGSIMKQTTTVFFHKLSNPSFKTTLPFDAREFY